MGTITRHKQQGAGTLIARPDDLFSTIILAGGRSSRMGQPKAAMRFGATTVLERLIGELAPVSDEVIVVAAPAADESFAVADLLAGSDGRIALLRDEAPFAGPVPALIRGLRAARSPVAFVCSCDLPLLQGAVARMLCAVLGDCDAAVPESDGRMQPLCAAYRKDAAEKIDALWRSGRTRVTAVVEQLKRRRVTETELRAVDPDQRGFINLNTPEDYMRALAIAASKD